MLSGLGAPQTKENITALVAWQLQEGGHFNNAAKNNPLNTTWKGNGSTPINNLGNGIGVQSYGTYEDGLHFTLNTLNGSQYAGIRSALMAGHDSSAVLAAVSVTPWGTKDVTKPSLLATAKKAVK